MKTKLKDAKKLLEETGYTLYVNDEVLKNAPRGEVQPIEMFNLGKYVYDTELDKEYEARGLAPADLDSVVAYVKANPDLKEKYLATHWQNDGFCYLAFSRWDGKRSVDCDRNDDGWHGHWWFVGVRKLAPSPKKLSQPSDTLLLVRVEKLEADVKKLMSVINTEHL